MKRRNYKRYMKKVKKANDYDSYRKEIEKATDKMLKDMKRNYKIIMR